MVNFLFLWIARARARTHAHACILLCLVLIACMNKYVGLFSVVVVAWITDQGPDP